MRGMRHWRNTLIDRTCKPNWISRCHQPCPCVEAPPSAAVCLSLDSVLTHKGTAMASFVCTIHTSERVRTSRVLIFHVIFSAVLEGW